MKNEDYAFYTENFEIYQFHFKTYGHGVWYNPEKETYDAAIERAKKALYDKVQKDNPHLIMFGEEKKIDYERIQVTKNTFTGLRVEAPYGNPSNDIEIPPKKQTPEEKMINEIETITDVKVLESFRLLAMRNDKIKQAYDNRLKQLTA